MPEVAGSSPGVRMGRSRRKTEERRKAQEDTGIHGKHRKTNTRPKSYEQAQTQRGRGKRQRKAKTTARHGKTEPEKDAKGR